MLKHSLLQILLLIIPLFFGECSAFGGGWAFGEDSVRAESPKIAGAEVVSKQELSKQNRPRIFAVTYNSVALKQEKRFVVILPKKWDRIEQADHRILVILHGRGRNERTLVNDKPTRQQMLDSGLFVILPDGEDGWYINSPIQKADTYETYLQEVLEVATKKYRLSKKRKSWAIAGWSMGGFGCINFAAKHPKKFVSVSSIIGLLDYPRTGLPAGQSYRIPEKRFGTDRNIWKNLNPIHQAEKLTDMSVQLITADQAFDRTMNENFHKRLLALKKKHAWVVLQGGHKFSVVQEAIPLVLEHTKQVFKEAKSIEAKPI